ncbi:uncharacterized protein LOC135193463 [Vanessa tameamea]|uniref:Uncharacterized protein LOC135193463 n=1 Tax=Vanessa tameamea TaxID=334116 RepID=A0ABM4ALC7_VANTA
MVSCVAAGKKQQQVLLATALVKAICRNGNEYSIRALLDQGSQASFVTESTVQYLGLKKTVFTSQIAGLGGNKAIVSKTMVTMEIKSRYKPDFKILIKAHVLKNITSLLSTRRVEAKEWQELEGLMLADPEYFNSNHIDLLLGADVYGVILQEGMKKNPEGTLIAQATSLGWILSGTVSCNIKPSSRISVMHCCESEDLLKKFWELESDVPKQKSSMFTEEERLCEQLFTQTTKRDPNGRYIVRLPFKNGYPEVTGSRDIAEKRLKSLEVKFSKDPILKTKYQEVISEYLKLDHMEEVPPEDINNPKAIYLPHHAVIRNDKETTKVRIVYDASCKGKNNLSLNDQLLVGPTLQPELRHIIMQWRCSPICMSADIVKMYRQVKVERQDADCQRILWRNNKNEPIKYYRHTRVTFGTSSAPYLAVKALQQVARDHSTDYPLAVERVFNNFYVDDFMTGVQTCEEGKQVFVEMNELLGKAGFSLQKWNSNDDSLVMEMNQKENREKDIKEEIKIKENEITKILGLTWNRSDDIFRYAVSLPHLQQPVTKRKIISDISRLYDPLGWVGPSIIIAKVMIQKLWLAGLDWDEEIPENLLQEWLTYREEQILLGNIRLPRWVGIKSNDNLVELHGFCDASKTAYAAAVYIRVIDSEGKVNTSLVTAKTKVAPVKQVSIPRLELCGAVLLTRLIIEVARVMKIEKHNLHAWTDSTIVLAWLNSHPSRWNVFVANRVSEILSSLDPQTWCHVTSKENPADYASRGIKPSDLVNNELWFHGPKFISCEPIIYHKPKDFETELETVKVHHATEENLGWTKFSSLTRTIRVVAYCRRFINNSKASNYKLNTSYLTAKELKEALKICIITCQISNFNKEISIIREKKNLPKNCKIRMLNPFLDNEGILRVGGRLKFSSLTFDRKHPILIPKESHLAQLIIADAHRQTLHAFLQAFKRFVARRGQCTHLWSDNGTNFTGASIELKKCGIFEKKHMGEVAESLAHNNCEWHFIPPHSPNFGGLWEAGIKSVKYHLKRVIGNSTLTFEEMITVLTQVEACLNSRPMSSISDDVNDFEVLTPGHFLIGEPLLTAPDYNFEELSISSLRRWQHTQRMLQTFWRKWSKEYLNRFLQRYKWAVNNNPQTNIGDIVIIKEDNLPPCRWLYGRVIATHSGADNIVRVVRLKTKNGILKRPISKLCFLPVTKN